VQQSTFLLIHGSWQAGWAWRHVREHLDAAGYRSLAPSLPGHAADDDRSAVTFADYESAVLQVLDRESGPVVLVGHSFGGAIISRIAELRPERCQSLIYYSGFAPWDGESVADLLPAAFLDMFRQLSAQSWDRSVALPYAVIRGSFFNTADEDTARRLFPEFTPEPSAPVFEPLALPRNHRHGIPSTFIRCRDDQSMPPGLFHPGQSSRLHNARLIEIDGDHEALLTNPGELAEALLAAVAPTLVG
jgi:pimeloyl-ACP methyl ester carboxylesterase